MAHRFSIKPVPYKKSDGTLSDTKKSYEVWDRTRGKRILLGTFPSQKKAAESIEDFREEIISDHVKHHPNDALFQMKHGLPILNPTKKGSRR